MPYNPGVVDRSGEILGAGIANTSGGLARLLEGLSLRQEQKEDEEKFIGGTKKLFRPQWKEMGFGSQAEYDNADARTIAGGVHARIAQNAIAEHEQQQQLMQEKLQELAGARQAQTRFNSMVGEAGAPSGALSLGSLAGDPMSLAPGSMAAAGANPARPAIGLAQMEQMAAQANLPIAQQLHLAQMAALAGKADQSVSPLYDEDPVTHMRMYRLGKQAIPTGVNPKFSGDLNQAVDSDTGEPIEGMFIDGRGRVVRKPVVNAGQQRKLSADAEAEAVKTLRGINDDIGLWNSKLQRSKDSKDTKFGKPPAQEELDALLRQKATVEKSLYGEAKASGAPAAEVLKVGTERNGYKFNGKFLPGDPRAWDRIK